MAPLSTIFRMRKWGACPRLLVRYPEGGANRQKRPVPSVFALNSDLPRHPAKLPVKPSQTFSPKRRSVAVQHCAFWGVLGGLWLGGKFSHAKSAIEHKRRYAHRVLDPSRAMSAVDIDPSSAGLRPPRRFLDGSCVIMRTSATQTEQNSSGGACAAHVDRVCSMA